MLERRFKLDPASFRQLSGEDSPERTLSHSPLRTRGKQSVFVRIQNIPWMSVLS